MILLLQGSLSIHNNLSKLLFYTFQAKNKEVSSMAIVEESGGESLPPRLAIKLPRVPLTQILAISIFWLALNFHWAALGIIILPSQVFKMVGDLNKGEALAFVLIPGAFVSLFANPLFGMLSDRTRGRLAALGRRRPYILIGTLVNIIGLIWMAASRDIVSLAAAYVLVQLSNTAATATFHALLPDMVPPEQRGLTSGVIGLLAIAGSIGGVIVTGLFIDAAIFFQAEDGIRGYKVAGVQTCALPISPAIPVTDRDAVLIGEFMHAANALFTPLTDPGDRRSGTAAWQEAQMGLGLKDVPLGRGDRSEERRVGKECRSRWSPDH